MIDILCWVLVAIVGIPLLMLAVECLLGASPSVKAPYILPPPFTVLIPAHDEVTGIAAVIRAVRLQLRLCDRVLVVADNCTDGTAAMAKACGAEVVERNDPDLRGKAYALAYGREALRLQPTPIIIVLDADCLPTRGALPRLAAHAAGKSAAVQGCYLLTGAPDATPLVRFSIFAFLVKNLVRQTGLQRLGGGALLQGTGMAFPWPMFNAAPLETASLVEDLKLGLDLRLAGRQVKFDPLAVFTSSASAESATQGQRTRWEHGSVTTMAQYVPRLIAASLRGRPALLVLAADIAVPPLALLASMMVPICALLALIAIFTGTFAPLLALLGSGAAATAALMLVWFRLGREILPAAMARQLPRYVLWKLPIYRRLAGARQTLWVRTSRKP
ncbi:glycosyl transferase [Novosphingobium barchaimii LL02]|uniref:Glycosyl transferase n=1 Tax=Novosphingobium barchaimii LL02 TaxID=1114963 RepID=A0A0J7XXY2_9SPHN|nr:glycosyltransferase family 2 protein [Novosphingobium barchaimii]KMS56387.1 glycosyl transferase [Novosphingobium barchaimii LL02]